MKKNGHLIFSTLLMLALLYSGHLFAQKKYTSGANEEIGWVIRKTENGIVKVPKRQVFKFDGTDVTGEVDRPFEGNLGKSRRPPRRSLIPVRKSFRVEMLDSVGVRYKSRSTKQTSKRRVKQSQSKRRRR